MCDCIELINEALVKVNAKLDVPFQINMQTGKERDVVRIPLPLYKLNPKKRDRLPVLFARFCPLCGVEYPNE